MILDSVSKKELNILESLKKKVRIKSQKCFNVNCDNLAIRSHVIQAEGPLRELAQKSGKIMQLEDADYFNPSYWVFKEIGIKQKSNVSTFFGFCNKCDSDIFRPIEKNLIDFKDNQVQLLYSYRSYLNEFYKQQCNLNWYEEIFKSNKVSLRTKKIFFKKNESYSISVKMAKYTIEQIENNLKNKSTDFCFYNFSLPKIEICSSGVFSFPIKVRIDKNMISYIKYCENIPHKCSTNFFHLIPFNNKLEVIVGCHKDDGLNGKLDIDAIKLMSEKEKFKFISDVLVKYVETWFISKSLFNHWSEKKMDKKILEEKKNFYQIFRYNHLKKIELNIFEK